MGHEAALRDVLLETETLVVVKQAAKDLQFWPVQLFAQGPAQEVRSDGLGRVGPQSAGVSDAEDLYLRRGDD